MIDDDFILDADESRSPRPYQVTGWEVVIFEIAEESEDGGPKIDD